MNSITRLSMRQTVNLEGLHNDNAKILLHRYEIFHEKISKVINGSANKFSNLTIVFNIFSA